MLTCVRLRPVVPPSEREHLDPALDGDRQGRGEREHVHHDGDVHRPDRLGAHRPPLEPEPVGVLAVLRVEVGHAPRLTGPFTPPGIVLGVVAIVHEPWV